MKKKVIKNFTFFITAALFSAMDAQTSFVYAAEYEITGFDDPAGGLINHEPPFVSGDILNIREDLLASANIGDLGQGTLIIHGNRHTIDGNGQYIGIIMDDRVYNYTIDHISFINFLNSSDVNTYGSALLNKENGENSVFNSTFSNNKAISTNGLAQGGAIYNNGTTAPATLIITNGEFYNNSTDTGINTKLSNGGGAIFNSGNTQLSLVDSIFENNFAKSVGHAFGGAVANQGPNGTPTVIKINNSSFNSNSSLSDRDTAYGGALYNNAQTQANSLIMDASFSNNLAEGVYGRGGAIYNDRLGLMTINNSIFKGNQARGINSTTGGAIDNSSSKTVVIRNSIFKDNSALARNGAKGGAIYNVGLLELLADEGFTAFMGNIDGSPTNQKSNAIHNDKTLYLNASKKAFFYIQDKIDGSHSSSTININMPIALNDASTSLANSPTDGNIIIFDTISNNKVNLYDGMLTLGNIGNNIVPNGSYFKNASLNLYGGSLNIANKNIDNITLNSSELSSQASLLIDTDLEHGLTDNFTITGTATGDINISGINILGDTDTAKTFDLFNGKNIALDALSLNVYTQDKKYAVTGGTDGKITFTPENTGYGLNAAVMDSSAKYKSFSASIDENITLALGPLAGGAGSVLTIFANAQNISGNRNEGLSIAAGQILKVFFGGSIDANNTLLTSIHNFFKVAAGHDVKGGFVENSGTTDIFSSVFSGNLANAVDNTSKAMGGVIYNSDNLSIASSFFERNTVEGGAEAMGGVLYNSGETSAVFVRFENNSAISSQEAKGGAVYNAGNLTLINSYFENNSVQGASALGGAIFNSGILNIIASNTDFEFKGNTANGASNAIYNENTVNLNAGQGNKIIFDDAVTGNDRTSSIININQSTDDISSRPAHGEILFNNIVSNSTVNLYSGVLSPSAESNLNGNNMLLSGGVLNFANNSIGTMSLNELTVTDSTRWALDLDLQTMTGDRILAHNVSGDGVINITQITALTDALVPNFQINIVSPNLGSKINLITSSIFTPIFQYNLYFDAATGNIGIGERLNPDDMYNPSVLAGPVTSQGSYLSSLHAYKQALDNVDMLMLPPNEINKQNCGKKKQIVWIRPYSTAEDVYLRNGPKISNDSYGSLFGADTKLYDFADGYQGMFSFFAGTNHTHLTYQGISIHQNGHLIGMNAIAAKGNFFAAATANIGLNFATARTMYGKEDIKTLTTGIALKTGYNFMFFDKKLILQPSYMMSYTFVNTSNYTNAAGVRISSSPLNAIQFAPGLKVIGNLQNGWRPYLSADMVWYKFDEAKFKANQYALPDYAIDSYVEYGLGIQKNWGENFSAFGEAMLRNGGRQGVFFQLGLKWDI